MQRKPKTDAGWQNSPIPGTNPRVNDRIKVPNVPKAKRSGSTTRVTPVPTAWKPLLPPEYYNGE